jgi:signal transduction histidine kinase
MASESPDSGSTQSEPAISTTSGETELAALAAGLFSPLAHDLRAGLNGISVWTHLLRRDGDDVGQRALEGIRRAVAHQSTLAQELSQFGAVLTAQRSRPAEAVPLEPLCMELKDEVRASCPDRRIVIHVPAAPEVWTHPDVLRQVVRLLLLDALAATSDDAELEIGVSETAGHLVLEVGSARSSEAGAGSPRRRSLRQAMAALAACMLGGYLEILPAEPSPRCRLHLPAARPGA